jgi:hypothetical protein
MCECMQKIDAELAKHNGKLATGFQITPDMNVKRRFTVATEKIDKSKSAPVPSVMCSHCPFCGEKLH